MPDGRDRETGDAGAAGMGHAGPGAPRHVVAVVVTMARSQQLGILLDALAQQRPGPDAIIVVDNKPQRETQDVISRHPGVCHLVSRRNLGGAGGFGYGILAALADGATHVWLMDDDGEPVGTRCLGVLLAAADQHGADVVAPMILDVLDPLRLAFPIRIGGRRVRTREEASATPVVPDFAHLFNGTLVPAEAFSRFGIPDYRLFLRGDEIDFLHRVLRGGGRVLTITASAFLHPSGLPEAVPVCGGLLHAVVPVEPAKRFHFFRNRGYLLRRHRLYAQALHDLLRYGWYFLIRRRGDLHGLRRWWHLLSLGMREDFRPYDPPRDAGLERNAGRLLEAAAPAGPATRLRPGDLDA
jgi:rhamnopyranosyl-N-acetylglucosaminyl-diphospho-decaprenol beta-1,3/1,4-galactofuranosyltransferase